MGGNDQFAQQQFPGANVRSGSKAPIASPARPSADIRSSPKPDADARAHPSVPTEDPGAVFASDAYSDDERIFIAPPSSEHQPSSASEL